MSFKKRNISFNDLFNTFYDYMVLNMFTDHTDNKKENLLSPLNGLIYELAAWDLPYASSHEQLIHTMAFVTSVVKHWLKLEMSQSFSAQWPVKSNQPSKAEVQHVHMHIVANENVF